MQSVLISIRPQWCAKIANGKKTIEVRKSRPKLKTPFKCYIYCTNGAPYLVLGDVFRGNWSTEYTTTYGYSRKDAERIWDVMNGQVIGEFTCDNVLNIPSRGIGHNYDYCFESLNVFGNDDIEPYITSIKKSRLSKNELNKYGDGAENLFAWHISELQIYDKPKELNEFSRFGFFGMGNSKVVCGNRGCEHFVESADYDEPPECNIGDCILTRPPESWMYVEEYDGKR